MNVPEAGSRTVLANRFTLGPVTADRRRDVVELLAMALARDVLDGAMGKSPRGIDHTEKGEAA